MRPAERRRAGAVPLLRLGFRPFFLTAGAWAVLAMVLWMALMAGHGSVPTAFDPLAWHSHEMIFGYAMAVVSGFLLTAIPNWTGRLPVAGGPLGLLVGLWLAGRVACATSGLIGVVPAAVIDMAYAAVLLGVVLREIIGGRNRRNLPMAAAVGLLLVANGLSHIELAGELALEGAGWRLGLATILMLIALVGGRVVPSFTRNWLIKAKAPRLPAVADRVDRLVLAATGLALVVWVIWPDRDWVGWVLMVSGVANLARLGRWAGWHTLAEPLVWVLHLGYAWLGLGLALLGLAISIGLLAPASAIHGLTVGAIGTMTLAIMTRASLGHSGRPLRAGAGTAAIFGLITLAALVRVLADGFGWSGMPPVLLAGGLWIAAFGLFVILYLPTWAGRDQKA